MRYGRSFITVSCFSLFHQLSSSITCDVPVQSILEPNRTGNSNRESIKQKKLTEYLIIKLNYRGKGLKFSNQLQLIRVEIADSN